MKFKKDFATPMLVMAVLALFGAIYAAYADSTDKLIPYKQIATVTVPSGLVFPGGGFDIAWTDSSTDRFYLADRGNSKASPPVPPGVDVETVNNYFRNLPGVIGFHHLHIWSLSTTQAALTIHLIKPLAEGDDDLLETVNQELNERFGISHATIQFERRMPADGCPSENRNR